MNGARHARGMGTCPGPSRPPIRPVGRQPVVGDGDVDPGGPHDVEPLTVPWRRVGEVDDVQMPLVVLKAPIPGTRGHFWSISAPRLLLCLMRRPPRRIT